MTKKLLCSTKCTQGHSQWRHLRAACGQCWLIISCPYSLFGSIIVQPCPYSMHCILLMSNSWHSLHLLYI